MTNNAEIRNPLGAQRLLESLQGPNKFLLESVRKHPERGRYSLIGANPYQIITIPRGHQDPACAFDAVWQEIQKDPQDPDVPTIVNTRALLLLSYEAHKAFDPSTQISESQTDDLGVPDILIYRIRDFFVIDHQEGTLWTVGHPQVEAAHCADAGATPTSTPPTEVTSSLDPDQLLRAIEQVQGQIREGNTYQANLTQRFTVEATTSPWSTYKRLSELNPACFAAFVETPTHTLVSASPERLLKVQGQHISTRPIKGTRRLGTDSELERFRKELREDPKEQAEHAMIVDLERNDLGKICEYASVQVTSLMEVVEYSNLIHMESEVSGLLRAGVSPWQVLSAMFPGGSITGTPKVRTMEILSELEPCVRGTYTGSLGYLTPSGDMELNILIRSILFQGDVAHTNAGGGITIDAVPSREAKENLTKVRPQLAALGVDSGCSNGHF